MLAAMLVALTGAANASPACVTAISPLHDPLNLRLRPDMQAEISATIPRGNVIYFTDDVTVQLFKSWVHVYGVESSERNGLLSGWVSRKFTGKRDEDVREFLKDVSSFANSANWNRPHAQTKHSWFEAISC
jgi:hypothetical protein